MKNLAKYRFADYITKVRQSRIHVIVRPFRHLDITIGQPVARHYVALRHMLGRDAVRTIIFLLATKAVAAAPGPIADQYGNAVSIAGHPGQPVLTIVVEGRKLRQIKGWEEGLRDTQPDLISLRVADITSEPRPTYEQVAAKLRKRAPKNVSILIDLQNVWATEYRLDTSEPCLLVFDAQGQVVFQYRGRANSAGLAEVQSALTDILANASVLPDAH